MGFARNPNQDELQRTLGGNQNASNTLPVATNAPSPNSGPWQKGQIVGSARPGANFARLGGGFGDANTDSMKHTFGRIAQNYDHNPNGLNALMQDEEFRRLFPTAKLDKDWIDFGGQVDPHTGTKVGKVDVMHAWDPTSNSGKNWQWLTEEEALAGAGGGQAGGGRGPMASVMPGQQSDLMAQILASLQLQQQPNIDPQALLLQQLMG